MAGFLPKVSGTEGFVNPQPKLDDDIINWNQYKSTIGEITKKGKFFLYRGQADATWPLKTTFHREADKTGMLMPQYLDMVSQDTHYHVSAQLNEIIKIDNTYEFASYLALLQHHGFPTPLLDWTLSPYIGAYFAFRECTASFPACGRVRIYVFDYDLWKKKYKQEYDLRSTTLSFVSLLRPFARYNPRQVPQNCVYTVTNISDVQGHIMNQKSPQPFLYKFDFSASIKDDVMSELDLMGINEMMLFPDMNGLCRTMKSRCFGS